jgi:hypothetical protein
MRQLGSGRKGMVDDVVRVLAVVLLSSRGCLLWYLLTRWGTCIFSTGSQVFSLSGYPFHLIRY